MQIQKNGDTLSANSSTNTLTSNSSVSYRKIIPIEVSTPKKNYSNIYGNRIIDVEILSDIFQLLCCPTCHLPQLKLGENISKKKGLASLLYLEVCVDIPQNFTPLKHVVKVSTLMEELFTPCVHVDKVMPVWKDFLV